MAKRNVSSIETLVSKDLPRQLRQVRTQTEKQLRQARTRTEKLATKTWKQALDLLPTGPRNRVKSTVANVEKTAANLQKRSERVLKNARKRGENLVNRIESAAVEAVKPIVSRLDIASRNDVERLSRRVAQIERRIPRKPKQSKHAAAA
jgi:exonuclease VII large subunit